MARKSRRNHYRCKACHSPIPVGYLRCGNCGHDHGVIVVNSREELTREYERAKAAITRTG